MKTALAIAAHPDDIEFLMSGTLMLLRQGGYEIHYWNLADGRLGSTEFGPDETARVRAAEAREAARSIGAHFHPSICPDLGIFYDAPTLRRVTSVIREVAPEILLTHSPVDYMEDHTNTCRLAVSSAFCRGMPNYEVEPPRAAISDKVTLYHAQPYSHHGPLGERIVPEFFVNVETVLDAKVEMLACHQSQKRWLDESQGLDSYLQTLRDLDAEAGQMSGVLDYAEGWRRHLHLGFCGPEDDPLRTVLAEFVHP